MDDIILANWNSTYIRNIDCRYWADLVRVTGPLTRTFLPQGWVRFLHNSQNLQMFSSQVVRRSADDSVLVRSGLPQEPSLSCRPGVSDIKHGGEPITASTPCNIYETLSRRSGVNISFTDKTGTSPRIELQREGASCCEQPPLPPGLSQCHDPHMVMRLILLNTC